MDTLFSNVTAVTMDEAMHVYFGAFVGVTDGKISLVSKTPPKERPKQIINGEGMVLMPGLINCHTHLPMSLLRGYADGHDLQTWLNDYIFPREAKLDDRAVKAATLLSIAECLRFGTTSVSDMYD
ncbi:MAG: amidohydrolase family protein, partial [Oscillospiraceae bacterium]|nr:amidohydrolase family protein [Oscillospiraceae bacterium]